MPVYRPVTEDELQQYSKCNFKFGSYYETLLIDAKVYLNWAMTRFEQRSGTIRKQKVVHFEDIQSEHFDYVFNCCGLGAQDLCSDTKLVPIRGQVFKVKNQSIRQFLYADFDTYIIPGLDNMVTLGGCRHYESYCLDWNDYDGDSIWERCRTLEPSLSKSQIESKWTGLRPHRDSVRVQIDQSSSGKPVVIHNYGHGGYGITSAPGTVQYAIELMKERLRARL